MTSKSQSNILCCFPFHRHPSGNTTHKKTSAVRSEALDQRSTADGRQPSLPSSKYVNILASSILPLPQDESLLLAALPPEIRHRIWQLTLGGNYLFIAHAGRREQASVDKSRAFIISNTLSCIDIPCRDIMKETDLDYLHSLGNIIKQKLLFDPGSLLRSCRQIYNEATPILYSANTFFVKESSAFNDFLGRRIVPEYCAYIQHLRLHFSQVDHLESSVGLRCEQEVHSAWNSLWMYLSIMKLRSLAVYLTYWETEPQITLQSEPIKPLLRVRGVSRAEIIIERTKVVGYRLAENERHYDLEGEVKRRWMSNA